jgi:chemotaxis protein CheD
VPETARPNDEGVITVAIGRWAVAAAPVKLRTLLGSCVAVILHDRVGRIGGIAHILLPDSQGAGRDQPGRYADTAIPGLLADLERLALARSRLRMSAKLAGGANMFATTQPERIGERNGKAVEAILAGLGIPVVARDLGGETGRRVTLETTTGRVVVKIPGGREYDI